MLAKKLFLIPLMLLVLSAAACPSRPLQTAQTIEQKGDALYGSYVIAKEQGAAIIRDATIPDAVKRPIAKAMVASKTMGDAGQDVIIAYSKVSADLSLGSTKDEKLLIASKNIEKWILDATPLITDLIVAVRGVSK